MVECGKSTLVGVVLHFPIKTSKLSSAEAGLTVGWATAKGSSQSTKTLIISVLINKQQSEATNTNAGQESNGKQLKINSKSNCVRDDETNPNVINIRAILGQTIIFSKFKGEK